MTPYILWAALFLGLALGAHVTRRAQKRDQAARREARRARDAYDEGLAAADHWARYEAGHELDDPLTEYEQAAWREFEREDS